MVLDPRHAFDEVARVLNTDGEALPGVPRHDAAHGPAAYAPAGADSRRACRPG